MDRTKPTFNLRAFTALMMTFSGLGLPVTGWFNHYYGLAPFTVARHAWMSAHNVLGLLFVNFAVWHLWLNRHAWWNHMKTTTGKLPALSREAMLAGAITTLVLFLFVGHAWLLGH